MSSVTLKNIPKHLHLAYKRRAHLNSRSLQSEILHTLSSSLAEDSVVLDQGKMTVASVAGMLKPSKKGIAVEEMDAAVEKMMQQQWQK